MSVFEKLVRTNLREQLKRVVYSVRFGVFFQVLEEQSVSAPTNSIGLPVYSHLIKRADGSHEDDGRSAGTLRTKTCNECKGVASRIIKERHPSMPLTSCTANVVQMPSYRLSMQRYIEDMLSHSHRLDSRMQDIIYKSCGQLAFLLDNLLVHL